jgi:hypothetical protein
MWIDGAMILEQFKSCYLIDDGVNVVDCHCGCMMYYDAGTGGRHLKICCEVKFTRPNLDQEQVIQRRSGIKFN